MCEGVCVLLLFVVLMCVSQIYYRTDKHQKQYRKIQKAKHEGEGVGLSSY